VKYTKRIEKHRIRRMEYKNKKQETNIKIVKKTSKHKNNSRYKKDKSKTNKHGVKNITGIKT
jgi:predicted type IV restriction endonuclease